MRWPSVCLCCLVFVFPSPASAGDELRQAQGLMKRMKYDQAMELALRVLRSPRSRPEDLVGAYRIQGLIHSARGDLEQAILAFRKLLSIQPQFAMRGVSPKLAAPFYQAVAEAREKGQRPIRLSHDPIGAAPAGQAGPLVLVVNLTADPFRLVRTVRLKLRTGDDPALYVERQADGPGPISVQVPSSLRGQELEYWFEARTEHGGLLATAGRPGAPFLLRPARERPVAATPGPEAEPAVGDGSTPATQPARDGSGAAKATGPTDGSTAVEADAGSVAGSIRIEAELHVCMLGNEIVGEQGGGAGDNRIVLGRDPLVRGRMGLNRWGWGLRAGLRLAEHHLAFLQLDHVREQWLGDVGAGGSTTWKADFDSLRLIAGYRFAWSVLDWLEPFAEAALGAHLYFDRTLRLVDEDSQEAVVQTQVRPDHRFALMLGLGFRFMFLERYFASASYLLDLPVGKLTSSSFILGGGATF